MDNLQQYSLHHCEISLWFRSGREGKAIQDIPPQESSQVPVRGGHDTCEDDKQLTNFVAINAMEDFIFFNQFELNNVEATVKEMVMNAERSWRY